MDMFVERPAQPGQGPKFRFGRAPKEVLGAPVYVFKIISQCADRLEGCTMGQSWLCAAL